MLSPSPWRRYSIKSLSWETPLLPSRNYATHNSFIMDAGYSKPYCFLKPHQEHVPKMDKFVWHFCINYILLNSVTRIIAYPIPHCDLTINEECGLGMFFWLSDAPMGYNWLAVALASQKKLAFQCLNAIKWTYTVMPFGPTNRLATFINFLHDVNSKWKVPAQQSGIIINNNSNTKIIVDDIFSWAKLLEESLMYMECQLVSARPTNFHWACSRVTSSLSVFKLLGLTFVLTEIVLSCQTINFLNTGLN